MKKTILSYVALLSSVIAVAQTNVQSQSTSATESSISREGKKLQAGATGSGSSSTTVETNAANKAVENTKEIVAAKKVQAEAQAEANKAKTKSSVEKLVSATEKDADLSAEAGASSSINTDGPLINSSNDAQINSSTNVSSQQAVKTTKVLKANTVAASDATVTKTIAVKSEATKAVKVTGSETLGTVNMIHTKAAGAGTIKATPVKIKTQAKATGVLNLR